MVKSSIKQELLPHKELYEKMRELKVEGSNQRQLLSIFESFYKSFELHISKIIGSYESIDSNGLIGKVKDSDNLALLFNVYPDKPKKIMGIVGGQVFDKNFISFGSVFTDGKYSHNVMRGVDEPNIVKRIKKDYSGNLLYRGLLDSIKEEILYPTSEEKLRLNSSEDSSLDLTIPGFE